MTEETTKTEKVKVPEKINVLSVSSAESKLRTALDVLFMNTFGNQINKKIYALQKELLPYVDEYSHLRSKISNNPKNVKGENGEYLSDLGLEELLNLNKTIGSKEIDVKCELPIKLKFLDCFSSNNRILLEAFGICEFED